MTRLTNEFIETEIEQPESGQGFYRYEGIPGFAIRATRKSKVYILEKTRRRLDPKNDSWKVQRDVA